MGSGCAILWILVTALIGFHIYLIYSQQTTYEYLIGKRTNAISPEP